MTIEEKAADRGDGQAASKESRDWNHNPIPSIVKAAIVRLALRRLLPRRAAAWLIQRGGLRDA
jgi:hypothetical protein